jgi:hypothetical protein
MSFGRQKSKIQSFNSKFEDYEDVEKNTKRAIGNSKQENVDRNYDGSKKVEIGDSNNG